MRKRRQAEDVFLPLYVRVMYTEGRLPGADGIDCHEQRNAPELAKHGLISSRFILRLFQRLLPHPPA